MARDALIAAIAADPDYAPPSFDELLEDMGGEQALLRALLAAGFAEHELLNPGDGAMLTALQHGTAGFGQLKCAPEKAITAIQALADGGADKTVIFTPPDDDDYAGDHEPMTLLQLAQIEGLVVVPLELADLQGREISESLMEEEGWFEIGGACCCWWWWWCCSCC